MKNDLLEPTCAHFKSRQMEIKQRRRHPRIDSSEPGVREGKHRLIAATFRKQQQKRGVKREKKPRTRPPGSHPQDTRRLKEKKIRLRLTQTNRFRSVHWRLPGRSSGCVSGGICAMEAGELADAEPRGLNVNCGLRHFTRMPLSRAAMQPSC